MATKNSTYLILTIILLILSAFGGYFLFQMYQERSSVTYNSDITPKIELIPTDSPQDITPEPTNSEPINSELVESTPTVATKTATIIPTKTLTPTKTPTPKMTLIPTISATLTKIATPTAVVSTGSTIEYSNTNDGFSVFYNSKRQFYQDTETSGNRYTFTNPSGNFAIHVSPGGKWSWTNSNRQFSDSFLVSGQPTFKYDISAQTIVDLQSSDKNYTIQCIHNGLASLKTECDAFISSFQLL